MKTEINLENKAKLFAQYWGQNVAGMTCDMGGWTVGKRNDFDYLELNTLSSISDEDAIEVAHILTSNKYTSSDFKIFHSGSNHNPPYISVDYRSVDFQYKCAFQIYLSSNMIYANISNSVIWDYVVSFLRSKGYALPWMGLSVDEMIKAGWIKLED